MALRYDDIYLSGIFIQCNLQEPWTQLWTKDIQVNLKGKADKVKGLEGPNEASSFCETVKRQAGHGFSR